ncbi:MAG: hypothetical protein A3J38_05460 [Gammaproteobacteria bacterium RIFCSPHIGHO2_12_FULL_45_9]|nr:MAG: hypothetical protein A3J38_05460 [Gammaproteobacteria bacterium RIFCSPHIGHO2_12_FULL_45_9]
MARSALGATLAVVSVLFSCFVLDCLMRQNNFNRGGNMKSNITTALVALLFAPMIGMASNGCVTNQKINSWNFYHPIPNTTLCPGGSVTVGIAQKLSSICYGITASARAAGESNPSIALSPSTPVVIKAGRGMNSTTYSCQSACKSCSVSCFFSIQSEDHPTVAKDTVTFTNTGKTSMTLYVGHVSTCSNAFVPVKAKR